MTGARVIRHGVVGCGRVFERFHLPCVDQAPGVELVALCDVDGDVSLADRPGLPVTTDLERFLSDGRLDSISVCTPNDAHLTPTLSALERGIAVLCEKPLAADINDARLMARQAESGPMFAVNLPYRFHPAVAPIREFVAAQEVEIELSFSTPGQRLWRPRTRWYGRRDRAGGGALLDLGIHAMDLLVALFGAARVRSCVLDDEVLEEKAEVELEFAAGPARVLIDRASKRSELVLTTRTEDGSIVLDIRRGQLRFPDGSVQRVAGAETSAVSAFFAAISGTGTTPVVHADDALAVQEHVETAYRLAARSPIGSTRSTGG